MIPRAEVIIELESSAPAVRLVCSTGEEEDRLRDWLESQPGLLDLVTQALALAEAKAA